MTTRTYDDETGVEIRGQDGVEVQALWDVAGQQIYHFATWAGAATWLQGARGAQQRLLLVTIRDRTVAPRSDGRTRPAPTAVRP